MAERDRYWCSWCRRHLTSDPGWSWVTAAPVRPSPGDLGARLYLCCPRCAFDYLTLGTPYAELVPPLPAPEEETPDA